MYMNLFKLLTTIVILLCASVTAYAKELTVHARVVVVPNPSYDTVVLVEFPFMVYRHEFDFYLPDSTEQNWYTSIYAQATIMDASGLPFDSAVTLFSVGLPSYESRSDSNVPVFNTVYTFLKPGLYSARVEIIDVVSKRTGNMFIPSVEVPKPEKSRLTVAATQLAYAIRSATANDSLANYRLIHHGLYVLTNPLSVFTDADSTAYLYGEIYNLPTDGRRTINYSFSALKEDGSQYIGLSSRKQAVTGSQRVLVEKIDIAEWPIGLYVIQAVVQDSASDAADTANIPIRIVSPRRLSAQAASSKAVQPFDTMTIATKEHLARWLLVPAERTILARLNDEGKDAYLRQFWAAHDPDRTTPENEFLTETLQRFTYANEKFSRNLGTNDGWESDRGRVHIVYGPCDEMDDISVPTSGEALQVWHYRSVREGKYFIFEQQAGQPDYKLLHSNVNGEPYSKRWETFYKSSLIQGEDVLENRPIDEP
jgi:GWxTD domain-containing protein